ncbi:MAG: hypothetical protein ACXVJ8_17355 [Candidatus Angelobacter sp.]
MSDFAEVFINPNAQRQRPIFCGEGSSKIRLSPCFAAATRISNEAEFFVLFFYFAASVVEIIWFALDR